MDWITPLVGFGGVAIGVLSNYLISRKKVDIDQGASIRDDFKVIVSELRLTIEKQSERIDELEKALKDEEIQRKEMQAIYEKRMLELNQRYMEEVRKSQSLQTMLLIANTNPGFPFPAWKKNHELVMVEINDAYEIAFQKPDGKKKSDYIGKTDREYWKVKEVYEMYEKHDRLVISGALPYYRGEEMIVTGGDDISNKWMVVKYRYPGPGGIGVAGFAIPSSLVKGFFD
jgi:hypothetical protein